VDLPPLPRDPSLAGIGDGQAGPVAPFPRGPGPGGAPQGEEVVVARRRGLEAANRRRRGKAEEALVEALRRLQARGERCPSPPPFPGPSRDLTGGCRGPYGRGSDPGPRFGVPGYPGRIPFHPREAFLRPPPLAGFMRGSPWIRRNSMQATPRLRPSLCAKVNFRENGVAPAGGEGVREASSPLEP
jgi:hypothetical protein